MMVFATACAAGALAGWLICKLVSSGGVGEPAVFPPPAVQGSPEPTISQDAERRRVPYHDANVKVATEDGSGREELAVVSSPSPFWRATSLDDEVTSGIRHDGLGRVAPYLLSRHQWILPGVVDSLDGMSDSEVRSFATAFRDSEAKRLEYLRTSSTETEEADGPWSATRFRSLSFAMTGACPGVAPFLAIHGSDFVETAPPELSVGYWQARLQVESETSRAALIDELRTYSHARQELVMDACRLAMDKSPDAAVEARPLCFASVGDRVFGLTGAECPELLQLDEKYRTLWERHWQSVLRLVGGE